VDRDIAPPFLTSELDGGEWSASRPGRITPGEKAPGTRWIEVRVGPRADFDAVEKREISRPCRESNPGRPSRSPSLYRLSSTFLLVNSVTREHSYKPTCLDVVETFNKLSTRSCGQELRHHFVVSLNFREET
jgi:hypothetical protein